jgi:adenosine deaminase
MSWHLLPKVELHLHLDGILDPDMVREIREEDPEFAICPEALRQVYPVRTYGGFMRWGELTRSMHGDLDTFRPVLRRHLRRLKEQRVTYVELMVGGSEIPRDRALAREKLTAFREWLDGEAGGEMGVELLVVFGRNKPVERVEEIAERVLALHAAGLIVGVALAGPEVGYPVRPFRRTFERFRDAGLGIEIHAGEWCGPESVRDALENGFPHRIGHGVSLFADERLPDLIGERGIHLEFCPSSNLKTGSIARIEEHPVRRALELGLDFSVNTDDPGPFENSMDGEHALLARTFGFGPDDFRKLYENTFAARFGK